MKLILFDIDGTLLLTNGAGRRAMEASLQQHFGTTGPVTYRYDGKTDAQIVRETMRESGIDEPAIDARLPLVLESYLQNLDQELDAAGAALTLMQGVHELLDTLEERSDRVLGLLTGNLARGAARKLSAVGVEPRRFRIGAYGSDHEHRHELPAIALARAQSLGMSFDGNRVIIVGDTPADIHCGRGIGARAIGVATGRFTTKELAEHGAAAVFENLGDTAAVIRAIDDA